MIQKVVAAGDVGEHLSDIDFLLVGGIEPELAFAHVRYKNTAKLGSFSCTSFRRATLATSVGKPFGTRRCWKINAASVPRKLLIIRPYVSCHDTIGNSFGLARSAASLPSREVRLSAGAEFVVAVCGDIMTMPGLPKVPAADAIDVGPDGKIVGLF